jgi:hypothetical protein
VVQRDALQLLGVTGWRRRAENRDDKWRPRSGRGCSAIHGWMDGGKWKSCTSISSDIHTFLNHCWITTE